MIALSDPEELIKTFVFAQIAATTSSIVLVKVEWKKLKLE